MTNLKTREEVQKEFSRLGMTVAKWSRENKVNPKGTYALLYGRNAGKRGEAHRIAVLLGLKEGVI